GADMRSLGTQSGNRAVLTTQNRERIIRELPHCVEVSDLVDRLTGQVLEARPNSLGRLRLCAVGARVIPFPGGHVFIEEVERLPFDSHAPVSRTDQTRTPALR